MVADRRMADQTATPVWPGIFRLVGVGLTAAFLVWFSVSFTFAMMGGNATARTLVPFWVASNAQAATASAIVQRANPSVPDLTMARELAPAVARQIGRAHV